METGCSTGTIEAYRSDLQKGVLPFFRKRGRFDLSSVDKSDIRDYMDFLVSEKGNSNITRRRKLAAIKSFFNYMVENEELGINPAASIKSPKITDGKPVYLNDVECLELLKTIARVAKRKVKDRDMAMVILFLHTGLRVSELINLKLTDIDLGSAQIKVMRKGNKEQYLHLNNEAVAALRKYVANRPQTQDRHFFIGAKGQKLGRNYVYDVISRYLKLAGMDKGKWGPHLLRHTFCTRLHQKGVDPLVIKQLAGHRSLDTTMKYVSIESKEEIQALEKLELGRSFLTLTCF